MHSQVENPSRETEKKKEESDQIPDSNQGTRHIENELAPWPHGNT